MIESMHKSSLNSIDGDRTMANVTFILNNKSNDIISYKYPLGNTILKADIPQVPDEENYVFNCWTSDERGLVPCDPQGFAVMCDVTFYGCWFDSTVPYADSATDIENRDGGVYDLPKGKVIFYGASNFTRWTTLEQDMAPELDALNHGIGGATDLSLLANLDRLVLRYRPCAVVIQCSNNDVHKYADEHCKQTKQQLYSRIREALHDTVIIFISHMPLPSRTQYWQSTQRLQDLNLWVKTFCDERDGCTYIDVFDDILSIANVYLSGNTNIYFDDASHFNAAGQKKFCEAMKSEIIKILS